ncbi:MAG: thermonuclease family protein [Burkholderiaceae bacterium]|nr:thermonuclease family protein [Burkholderiaceae bacterium]
MHGREVCKVYVDGLDVGLEQILRGMAWHFKRYEAEQPPQDRRAYGDAEVEARSARRGLWRDAQPVPPWEWRTTQRNAGDAVKRAGGRQRVTLTTKVRRSWAA